MNPKDMTYQSPQYVFYYKIHAIFLDGHISIFKNSSKDKDKWNFIKEAENTRRTKTMISCLKKSFAENFTDQKRISDLLTYQFSKLVENEA